MKLQEILVLLPCHTLEDFPLYHEGEEAESLLAAWTALWHPRLIASAEKAPTWARIDDPPEDFEGRLIVVPTVVRNELQAGWAERAESEGAVVVRGKTKRDEIIAESLAAVDSEIGPVDANLAADFPALGFAFLTVELLTRQFRYTSHVDEIYFQNETVAAALAAVRGENEEAREHLGSCFDILVQARDQYYPVDSYLIDFLLVAPTTIGPALREELAAGLPTNVLASGEVVERMAREEPETLAALKHALEHNTATLVGGEYREEELPLLPIESILEGLLEGRSVYRQHLQRSPAVFGRRRYGLSQVLPQILRKLGFQGAVHVTLDAGKFPQGEQSKSRWEGHDGSTLDMLSRIPCDISKPETFLNLSHQIGDAMDHDHVATVCFARWPGQPSEWYDDMRRIAAYGPVLGKFIALDEYFASTDTPDIVTRFEADEYSSPYLRQSVAAGEENPLSRYVRLHREHAARQAAQSARVIAEMLGSAASAAQAKSQAPSARAGASQGEAGMTARASQPEQARGDAADVAEAIASVARAVPGCQESEPSGRLLVNPCGAVRRVEVQLERTSAPAVQDHVRAAAADKGSAMVVADVPAMGFAWLGPGPSEPPSKRKPAAIAEDNALQNEFLRATIKPETGCLQALHSAEQRGNLLSQQLAFRQSARRPRGVQGSWQPPGDPYSIIEADSVEVAASNTVMGQIVARGRLTDRQGNLAARFTQRYTLWRSSRVLHLEIELEPAARPGPDPWDSYFACRFAWADSAAHLWRSSGMVAQPNVVQRVEAPHFLQFRFGGPSVSVFTGGLPFHRRSGERMLDTLLMVRGETQTRFELGIGVGIAQPMINAWEMLVPTEKLHAPAACPSTGPSGWLFHLDARNVLATHWEPVHDDADAPSGFRVRLLETSGRGCRAGLSAFRDVAEAHVTDFLGQPLCDLPIEQGRILVDLAGYEWAQVEAVWKA